MKFFFLLQFIFILFSSNLTQDLREKNQEWFNEVTNPERYKKYQKPYSNNEPTTVNISVYFKTLASIDEVTTEFSAQFFLQTSWYDERLLSKRPDASEIIENDDYYLNRIWNPQIYIPNNQESTPIRDTKYYFFKISPNGIILTSKRIKIKVFCETNLKNYPYDYQICEIAFESSALPKEKLKVKWNRENPFLLTNSFNIFGYELYNVSVTEDCSFFPEIGYFSNAVIKLEISRKTRQYILDYYVPTILFVAASWIGFWIEIAAAPARVSLCATQLALFAISKAFREKLPRISYFCASDLWFLICILFVFSTLIEYAVVNHIYWKDKRCKKRRLLNKCSSSASFFSLKADQSNLKVPNINESDSKNIPKKEIYDLQFLKTNPIFTISDEYHNKTISKSESLQFENLNHFFTCKLETSSMDFANSIDRKCRLIFPFLFITFNLFFYLYFK